MAGTVQHALKRCRRVNFPGTFKLFSGFFYLLFVRGGEIVVRNSEIVACKPERPSKNNVRSHMTGCSFFRQSKMAT